MLGQYRQTVGNGPWTRPPLQAWPQPGHPLAPAYAILYNEQGGKVARTWRRAAQGGPPYWGAGAQTSSTAPHWGTNGALFSGTEFHMLTAATTALNYNRNFTVVASALINVNVSGTLVSWPQNGYQLSIQKNTNLNVDLTQSRVADILSGGSTVTQNVFHTVGFSVGLGATATCKVWLDGKQDGSTTTSATFSSANDIRIGTNSSGSTNTATSQTTHSGAIAWIYWYDRALSANEMSRLHQDPFGWLATGQWLFGLPGAASAAAGACLLPAM